MTPEQFASRSAFEADLAGALKPGKNVLAIRVDHTNISELFLGGIIRPIVVIDRAAMPL